MSHQREQSDEKIAELSKTDESAAEYAFDTARKLISLYPWYYLPPSVHKILVHASDVINHAFLPIGELSE